MVSPSAINKICNPRPIPFHSPLFTLPPVHKFVEFCFQIRYWLFKSGRYLINRKVTEAVSRLLSLCRSSFLPLFFPNPKRKTPDGSAAGGFSAGGRAASQCVPG